MALEYHEDRAALPSRVIEQHRAIASLIEELEAVAWYHQRAAASDDDELRSVIEHNRDEEIEHASMLFEWLRRNFPGFDEKMRIYLFQDKPILQLEVGRGGRHGGERACHRQPEKARHWLDERRTIMTGVLRREAAPIAGEARQELVQQARRVIEQNLAARRVVDLDGPHGCGVCGHQHGAP